MEGGKKGREVIDGHMMEYVTKSGVGGQLPLCPQDSVGPDWVHSSFILARARARVLERRTIRAKNPKTYRPQTS